MDPKYLTTVIPYHLENGTPDNQALQVLIKSKKFHSDLKRRPKILTGFNFSSLNSSESDK